MSNKEKLTREEAVHQVMDVLSRVAPSEAVQVSGSAYAAHCLIMGSNLENTLCNAIHGVWMSYTAVGQVPQDINALATVAAVAASAVADHLPPAEDVAALSAAISARLARHNMDVSLVSLALETGHRLITLTNVNSPDIEAVMYPYGRPASDSN